MRYNKNLTELLKSDSFRWFDNKVRDMTHIYYIDGEFVNEADALLPATDLSILRGYGVFDYLRTYAGKPFHLQAHLERLQNSARLIGLELPYSLEAMTSIIDETLNRNQFAESAIRIVLTGGDSPDNIVPVSGAARLIVMVTPAPVIPAEWYSQGVKVITHRTERYLPEAKTLNYIPAIIALQKAQRQQAIDALYIDDQGNVLEGTTTNLFAFYGDTLVTPGEGILHGITRQAILDVAADHFEVRVQDMDAETLLEADELFLTSSNKEICPIRQVDDVVIGNGKPGANTIHLHELFRAFTAEYAHI